MANSRSSYSSSSQISGDEAAPPH
ncbi:hypothetical protein CCACVL1_03592 [Corchorus capsularis]|uniref:Uncharacterized protein n=1 Tax=Corchorus capsularis TaxID=210143 RepID=A0A1R3JYD4_COCAP|nr:hypothetical protein CCACVL1_03592 [Corchorus capsularis]